MLLRKRQKRKTKSEKRKTSFVFQISFFISLLCAVSAQAALDCAPAAVRCVGAGQEYSTIQAAANVAVAGDTVQVFDGTYRGFEINRSGAQGNPITFKAAGTGAVINTPVSGMSGNCNNDAGICFAGNGSLQGVHDIVVEGFVLRNTYRCISAHSASPETTLTGEYPHRRITLRNNSCNDSGHEGFYLSEFENCLIEGNTITGTGTDGTDRGHGIYLANAGADNTILRGNTISNTRTNDSAIMHFNGDSSIGGDGLISGLTIENNILFGGKQNGINMDGVQNSVIRNNLIYGNAYNGIIGYSIDAAQGPKNMKIYNNTIIVPSGSSDFGITLRQDAGGHVIFNNVLMSLGSSGGSISVDNANFTSNYNAVVNRLSRNDDTTSLSFAQWQQAGQDANSFVTTSAALFVNSAAGDYHLKLGAPAINTGVAILASVAAPGTDASGATRPQGAAYDMGAYEFGSVTPPPPPGSACDVDNSGSTNVTDVQLCVNQAINPATCSTGDVNKNGSCNVIDVQLVVNAALGGQCVTQ